MDDKLIETMDILNENIPRDLYNAYKLAGVEKYASSEHPATNHYEVSTAGRRSVQWDYGKATYREISADEAIRLVAEDPHNVEKLRGIKNGELVEYEYDSQRQKFYAMYANPNRAVQYTKPNGDVVVKRNIRYITNPKIWIPLLDKIYWTDEYDYPISPERQAERAKNNEVVGIGRFAPVTANDYSQFRPFVQYTRDTIGYERRVPDTGRHGDGQYPLDPRNYGAGSYHGELGPNERPDHRSLSWNTAFYRLWDEVVSAYSKKRELFTLYTHARKALKKIMRDKDDFDAEEYEELFNSAKARFEKVEREYNEAALKFSRLKSQATKNISNMSDSYIQKYGTVLFRLQNALVDCEQIKKNLDTLASSDALNLPGINKRSLTAEERASISRARDEANRLKNTVIIPLIDKLNKAKRDLQAIEDAGKIPEETADGQQYLSQIEQYVEALKVANAELDDVRQVLLKSYLETYKDVQARMDEVEAAVNALKPTRAARKAAKAAKAGAPTLDPKLAHLIQFEDDTEDNTEDTNTSDEETSA